jgi:hypothetical protein
MLDGVDVALTTLILTSVATVAAIIAAIYAAIPVHVGMRTKRRERLLNLPGVKAYINGSPSIDGWRSVLLHTKEPETFLGQHWDPVKAGWRIEQATLLEPKNVRLAFARKGDGSLYGPIVSETGRTISNDPPPQQPFAMEFFLRFPTTPVTDHGKRAKFRVVLLKAASTVDPPEKLTLDVWGGVPMNADTFRQPQD